MFTQQDAQWLSRTVGNLYATQTIKGFVHTAMNAIDARFHLLASSCEEVGMQVSSYSLLDLRTSVPSPPDHVAFIHDNPLRPMLASCGSQPVQQLRRIASFAEWSRTDHFNGIARPMGFRDQVLIAAQSTPTMVGIGLFRDTLFTEHEISLGKLIQPHLAAAWQRVRGSESQPEITFVERLTVTAGLSPLNLTAPVRLLFKAYFPDWRGNGSLPPSIQAWLKHSRSKLATPFPLAPLKALKSESARGRLVVRCFPEPSGLIQLAVIEYPATPNFFSLRETGLTARECEVMYWLARGKRDAEIARILSCAIGTIRKHVEHILAKFSVENRAAAVRTAEDYMRRKAPNFRS